MKNAEKNQNDFEKIGSQNPTVSVIPPYTDSKGISAVEIYEKSGQTAFDWQKQLVEDIMATDENGKWKNIKFGFAVPRRNGKSEVILMRIVKGLTDGEHILYTAHRTATSHSMWERVVYILAKAGYVEKVDFVTTKQFGLEHIEMRNGVLNFRTRSSKGGLGEGYDTLIIDEAQEYTNDQETALKYIVSASKNPQTIMCGTPPTAVSAGTVFTAYREKVLCGKADDNVAWAEWSVDEVSDVTDIDLWYKTNPSLNLTLTERSIRAEIGTDTLDFNIQRLGYWVKFNLKSAISKAEWAECLISRNEIDIDCHKLFFGVKYGKNTVSLAVAVKLKSDDIFIEAVDCRPIREGNSWIISYIRNPNTVAVVADGAGNQEVLKRDAEDAMCRCKIILPTVKQVVESNILFEKNIFSKNIRHSDQPSLTQAVANCDHRAIGTGGGFGYSPLIKDVDITLVEAVSLAYRECYIYKPKAKQKIFY